jgi:hypothetical protein
MEFRWPGIPPSTRNSLVSTEFPRQHGIPPLTQNSTVDTEFPCQHGIPPSARNSPVSTEFPHRHGIPSTRNSVDAEFRRHEISPIFLLPCIQYAMLCYLFSSQLWLNYVEFCEISRILRASLYNMYEFEYFQCKFVRIKSKICGTAEVESASFFLSPLIAHPLISHTESVCQSANFFLVR